MLTKEKRAELRRALDAIPRGPWAAEQNYVITDCTPASVGAGHMTIYVEPRGECFEGGQCQVADYIAAAQPDAVRELLDYIDDMERRNLAADRAVATAAQTIASLREHMASGGATARVQELTRELHEVRRQLREVTQERDAARGRVKELEEAAEALALDGWNHPDS